MYEAMQSDYYWLSMARNMYKTVRNCQSYAKPGTILKQKRHLQLFPETGPSEFIAMDIFGSLPRKTKGNWHVVIITDKYFKLTRAVPSSSVYSLTHG